ncbi:Zinc finger CCCH type domain containing protein [Coccidioides posadasii C735 delta SOWgp]|uniref:Zinc finger CCCH type domain containing protein n=1 Tax=Coccidioides posadasii (strain C735) TaxID=222929 RepID=C5P2S8_COCP7|nr:Zinc finger CCCH type domain containing protein [Coccidioides posadasii C735 delta SOWgp]EER28616.1 Zinc finger CCCH type domain containing protein [Coccidioides posadasii C735 delta SOWgp]|eukprot:XP_003070761.1 Zinc finger CCCH type domain containing protein [Coccidioides posadasii C735 delta SOWgp]
MAPGGFSFPPPPPPPPSPAAPAINSFQGAQPQSSRGRGGRGAGSHHRGRGRGTGHVGGRGGYIAGPPAANYGPPQSYPYHASNNPPSQYNMPGAQRPATYPARAYGQPHATAQFPPPQSPYGSPVSPQFPTHHQARHPPPPSSGYPPQMHSPLIQPPHAPGPGPPAVMSPPMRWGFDHAGTPGAYPPQQNYTPAPPHAQPRQPHERQGGYRQQRGFNASHASGPYPSNDKSQSRMNKRPHSAAFTSKQDETRPTAPLPVPSFGNPLPSKPPAAVDATRKPKKKRRKYNQLGLTPKAEEHESSEDEDDVDEETKLATQITENELKITYRGRTATLQSAAEITAWIEERKQRYPTIARVEERKKELQERKLAREAKKAEQEEQRRQREADARKRGERRKAKTEEQKLDPADAAEKAKLKAEKLRRKLIKEEKRVARAEAAAAKARRAAEALASEADGGTAEMDDPSPGAVVVAHRGDSQGRDSMGPEGVPLTYGPASPSRETKDDIIEDQSGQAFETELSQQHRDEVGSSEITAETPGVNGDRHANLAERQAKADECAEDLSSDISSETSDTSDETTSSGSDSSSDEGDDGSAPEEMTTKRERPDRVPPPPRKSRNLCHQFVKTGKCRRGENCRYVHEVSDKHRLLGKESGSQRPGLFQALLGRQREEEDQRVMQAISWLGGAGVLDEPETGEAMRDGGDAAKAGTAGDC